MDKKTIVIANCIALVVMLVVNYLSSAGVFNGNTMASVSAQYENLFTPAGYAFGIWGVIYLGLAGFCVYLAKFGLGVIPERNIRRVQAEETIYEIGWLFVASCIANCGWILAWLYGYIGISVIIMLLLLYFLFRIIIGTDMEFHASSKYTIFFVWWPFSIYTGWVTVALFANLTAYLTQLGWNGFTEIPGWTLGMICLAGILNLWMTWSLNMREFAVAGAWGIFAVGVANWNGIQVIAITAFLVAVLLIMSAAFHAYKNRGSFLSTE